MQGLKLTLNLGMATWTQDTSITYLKGVGPQRAQALASELGIRTYGDLLQHFPFRYIDRSIVFSPETTVPGPAEIQIRGTLSQIVMQGKGPKQRLTAQLLGDAASIELVWFKGVRWVQKSLQAGQLYVAFGRITDFQGRKSMAHPELELDSSFRQSPMNGLYPVYSTTEKLTSMGLHARGLAKLIQGLLLEFTEPDWLPPLIVKQGQWPSRGDAMIEMHFPKGATTLAAARQRLAFEEVFLDQLVFAFKRKASLTQHGGLVFPNVGEKFNTFFHEHLPFALTGAQKRVLKEIRKDTASGLHMNRLVQGDVGSGKTMVAFMALLIALDNGYQGCLMAPTEILAQQHYISLSPWCEALGIRLGLLTGSVKAAARKPLIADLSEGSLHILVGTHALLEDPVIFQQLGMAIVDEQHRFGVAQRAKLRAKNLIAPHILVMTATPIPRTLAMSLYGDLDLSVIDELPPGRKPIQTVHRTDHNRLKVWGFLKEEIAKGRQVYIVYPLIEESKTLDFKDLMDGYESICRDFPRPSYEISIVHGRMKSEDKTYEMGRFVRGETQLMVATTVIEVGVNVPNASVMVIENAERFGLSQLHQLRGRVGRGADQSFCILMTGDKLSDDGQVRIETMVRTQDGFEVADVDLQLRGPGDIMGTRQSGLLDYKVANLAQDQSLIEWARKAAQGIVQKDPQLIAPEHAGLRMRFTEYARHRMAWGHIA
jgi:ATP-dependent DNA helicase RecG